MSLILENRALRAEILPQAGGGLLRFDLRDGDQLLPLLRPGTASAALHDPNALACYPLVPWSNRIGDACFMFDDKTIAVPRNRDDEPYPLHGHGWLSAWQTEAHDSEHARLNLHYAGPGPFTYLATLKYRLFGMHLDVTLGATNLGARLPFGLGLHPFFPRTADAQLHAPAGGMWEAGPDHLPLTQQPLSIDVNGDNRLTHLLDPERVFNNCFAEWDGLARIHWPQRGIGLQIDADVHHYVLYTPAGQDFFCFEPVDHPVNAHNMHHAVGNVSGLTVLEHGATVSRHFQFTAYQLASAGDGMTQASATTSSMETSTS
jgi:aldose 1-epimerase